MKTQINIVKQAKSIKFQDLAIGDWFDGSNSPGHIYIKVSHTHCFCVTVPELFATVLNEYVNMIKKVNIECEL